MSNFTVPFNSTSLNLTQDENNFYWQAFEFVASTLGYIGTSMVVGAAIPQIITNYRNKLNPVGVLMSVLLLQGRIFSVISLVPVVVKKGWTHGVISNLATLGLGAGAAATLLVQNYIYRNNKPKSDKKDSQVLTLDNLDSLRDILSNRDDIDKNEKQALLKKIEEIQNQIKGQNPEENSLINSKIDMSTDPSDVGNNQDQANQV